MPIENSLEGAVNATLDALAFETERRRRSPASSSTPIHHCLIARDRRGARADRRRRLAPAGQRPVRARSCAHGCRAPRWSTPPRPPTRCGSSPSASDGEPWAALGSRAAAELYGCAVLARRRRGPARLRDALRVDRPRGAGPCRSAGAWKTALMFWEPRRRPRRAGSCAASPSSPTARSTSPASSRGRGGEGSGRTCSSSTSTARADDPPVAQAIGALRSHAEGVRVLGSFPAAP